MALDLSVIVSDFFEGIIDRKTFDDKFEQFAKHYGLRSNKVEPSLLEDILDIEEDSYTVDQLQKAISGNVALSTITGYTSLFESADDKKDNSILNEGSKTYTTKDIVKFAKNAGEIVLDAKDAIEQLSVAYGDKVPHDKLISTLTQFDLELDDVKYDRVKLNKQI